MNFITSILEQGLIYGILALGIYITYKILDFPDLTVDGSFPLGAAITAALLTRGMTFFVIKYIVVWALAFVAAVILNRTIWRKVLSTTAVGDAEDQFDRRCRLNGGPVSSEIHFFDDHFDSVTAKKTRSFSYQDVTKILETKEAFGVVVKADPETVGSARAMIGFPKTALEGNNTDELAEFLLERCRNMKRKKVKKF